MKFPRCLHRTTQSTFVDENCSLLVRSCKIFNQQKNCRKNVWDATTWQACACFAPQVLTSNQIERVNPEELAHYHWYHHKPKDMWGGPAACIWICCNQRSFRCTFTHFKRSTIAGQASRLSRTEYKDRAYQHVSWYHVAAQYAGSCRVEGSCPSNVQLGVLCGCRLTTQFPAVCCCM